MRNSDDRMESPQSVAVGIGRLFEQAGSQAEVDNLRALLCSAVERLAPLPGDQRNEIETQAFGAIVEGLKRFGPAALLFKGGIDFLDFACIQSLAVEAAGLFPRASEAQGHLYHPGGEVANSLSVSPELCRFMQDLVPECQPTGIASYVYYCRPGHGIPPHIDTNMFLLNVLIVLEHAYSGAPSNLVIYPDGPTPITVKLAPGDVVVFDGGSLVHAREKLGVDERLSILTIGFHPR
ncbi:MAG: 2OG-Fe(II) oxygenase [Burkholderiales bacterium]|nr:2OG-Fe(II) oxygenase [Burkholderiales bacterium]